MPPPEGPTPPLLDELTPEDWGRWLQHPITAMVLNTYLPAEREMRTRFMLDQWLSGALPLAASEMHRGIMVMSIFMERIRLDDVRAFWHLPAWNDRSQDKRP